MEDCVFGRKIKKKLKGIPRMVFLKPNVFAEEIRLLSLMLTNYLMSCEMVIKIFLSMAVAEPLSPRIFLLANAHRRDTAM